MDTPIELERTRSPAAERPDARRHRRDSSSPPGSPMFSPRLPSGGAPDSRTNNPRRIPSRTGREDRPAGGSMGRLKGHARPPLLPVTERKGHEEAKVDFRSKKDSDGDRIDITPDGGSASREGRKFTVANVGNNGRIYLRPTIRPAYQRYPQPNFVFPMTPPATATLESTQAAAGKTEAYTSDPARSLPQRSQLAVSQTPTSDSASRRLAYEGMISPGHRRALSDSTVPESNMVRDTDAGAFKVVITQPGEEHRPRTVEMEQNDGPFLDIAIPSWKIGSPRFTPLGTPMIQGSSAGAPTEDIRSTAAVSPRAETPLDEAPKPKKPTPISIPSIRPPSEDAARSPVLFSPLSLRPLRSTYLSTRLVIEPGMFDDLTFKPACDDRLIVRYSAAAGAVSAATPPRLVAEITSPSFLDYELLSDFFLTFRAFLETNDLLKMLVARLRWALRRTDEAGMVVRVRTFVALRHWILNYFVDDFVIDYDLRVTFCNLLNDLVDELSQDPGAGKVQVKILGELKKCWRRICSQYWDGPDFDSSLGPEAPISPGGIAGHRRASLEPGFWGQDDEPPQLDAIFNITEDGTLEAVRTSFAMDVSRAGHIDSIAFEDESPTTAAVQQDQKPPSAYLRRMPLSVSSIDVISCSFPAKNMLFPHASGEIPPAVHPVDPTSISTTHGDPVATTPRALTGKRVRPQQPQHKRNGSLTDSLRDRVPALDKQVLYKDAEPLMAIPWAGSLVRGAMFPPAQAFVEIPLPNSAGAPRQTTVFNTHPLETQSRKLPASAMSSQGMRKLLSSVRRALRSKGTGISPAQGHLLNISPLGPRGATTNRLPGTAIVPQARPRLNGTRPPVRIDVLGAEVAEDFEKAVREDAAAEAASFGRAILEGLDDIDDDDSDNWASGGEQGDLSDHLNTSLQPHGSGSVLRPSSDAAITTGSQSIVIVDDTIPTEAPIMTGALPVSNHQSIETFAEALMYTGGADPTPPDTPPSQTMGTPRKSSYVLRHHLTRQVNSEEIMTAHAPAAGLDRTTRSSEDTTRPSTGVVRPSVEFKRQSSRRPPLSGVRGHFRQRSSRSYWSTNSFGRTRYASFTSGIAPRPTVRSFATSTYSDTSIDDAPATQPLRMLRRRPGGDLRAVTNIGELHPLRRSRSVGSLTTYSESVRSSYIRSQRQDSSGFVDVVTSEYSHERAAGFSLGAITEQHPKKISLFSTHSSKPVMRPSFEAEAQKLAQIPDDADDDGGVEAALLKLEGKFDKKAFKLSMEPRNFRLKSLGAVVGDGAMGDGEKKEHRRLHINDDTHLSQMVAHKFEPGQEEDVVTESEADTERTQQMVSNMLTVKSSLPRTDSGLRSFVSGASGDSYSSIPLLERGLADEAGSNAPTRQWAGLSVLQDADAETETRPGSPSVWEHMSFDFINKTDSLDRIQPGETQPQPQPNSGALMSPASFLDDDSDDGTDLSSELSVDLVAEREDGEMYIRKRPGTIISGLPAHPLGEPSGTDFRDKSQALGSHPPSPPMTMVQALQMSPGSTRSAQMHRRAPSGAKPLPPTPDATPTTAAPDHGFDLPRHMVAAKEAQADAGRTSLAPKSNAHLPFILAFDSEMLAQQFTLIEKDALNEIDWKELIEMRWKNAANIDARSWVDFLRNSEARGVEVVIARFNIMVKWCVSEIVLTQDLEERARCVIKLIHIAAHCRRFRNFATMSQIAMALTSQEVSRLSRTWAMVPANDLATLRNLETLVSPTRNFYTLRAEMEGGGIASADTGCIPFVGIYMHDLLYNAQRPSEIASSPTTPPLVNFERCRIAAGVVKTLLRLLEASTLYSFQPIEGITERCLWMGALNDDEIRRLSESLET